MATGGFRDISTLSTGQRPRSITITDHDEEDMRDVEMNAATALLEEDDHYFGDERNPERHRPVPPQVSVGAMAGVRPLVLTPASAQPPRKLKSILKSLKADRTILLSRPRVVFRMFSLLASGAALGASAHIIYYARTAGAGYDSYIWGKGPIDLTPTSLLLAASVYIFLLDLAFSISSLWQQGRYLKNRLVAVLALLHSVISFTIGITALVFSDGKRYTKSMVWDCAVEYQSDINSTPMDFSNHCTELRAISVAVYIYTVAHGLIIPTIVLGFISCSSRKRAKFQDVVIIGGDSEKGSIFQWFGDLKGRFTRNKYSKADGDS